MPSLLRSTLADLSELSLDDGEKIGRTVGNWKEYIKSDGRVWYYNTETGEQVWRAPECFAKLDEVSAAAAEQNAARGK